MKAQLACVPFCSPVAVLRKIIICVVFYAAKLADQHCLDLDLSNLLSCAKCRVEKLVQKTVGVGHVFHFSRQAANKLSAWSIDSASNLRTTSQFQSNRYGG